MIILTSSPKRSLRIFGCYQKLVIFSPQNINCYFTKLIYSLISTTAVLYGLIHQIKIETKIIKLQRRACKIILITEYSDLITAMTRLNISSFDETVFLQKAKIMYKTLNGLVPVYLSEMFNMQSTRLSYSGAIIWNSIPLNIQMRAA